MPSVSLYCALRQHSRRKTGSDAWDLFSSQSNLYNNKAYFCFLSLIVECVCVCFKGMGCVCWFPLNVAFPFDLLIFFSFAQRNSKLIFYRVHFARFPRILEPERFTDLVDHCQRIVELFFGMRRRQAEPDATLHDGCRREADAHDGNVA